jgi:hypothetical protein
MFSPMTRINAAQETLARECRDLATKKQQTGYRTRAQVGQEGQTVEIPARDITNLPLLPTPKHPAKSGRY